MAKPDPKSGPGARLARHRLKTAATGSRRVEVVIPAADAPLIKAVAGVLRSGGAEAARVRAQLQPLASPGKARTGAELVAFLRASPLVGADLDLERDRSTGRTIELE